MRSLAATLTIARSRFRTLWPTAAVLVVLSGVVGWFQQNSLSQFSSENHVLLNEPNAWLFGPLVFTTAVAIVVAYANTRSSRSDIFAFCEEAAPLFGRERARASALVPILVILSCCFAEYVGARMNPNYGTPPTFYLFDAVGALAAMMVALSIPLRSPQNKILYTLLAFGAALLCGLVVVSIVGFTNEQIEVLLGNDYFDQFNDVWGGLAEIAFAAIIGFVALRQYGEALARYDPVPE